MTDNRQQSGAPAWTVVAVFMALGALFALTGLVTGAYRSERRSMAEQHYQLGSGLARQSHNREALEQFQTALSFSHDNPEYQLALARALLDLGRLDEAESHLRELRQNDPTDGVVNLLLARIAARQGKADDAVMYYHTAIYGLWPDHPEQRRIETRLELVDMLMKRGGKRQALAELLEMMDRVPADDIATRKRLGALLLACDAPRQAADVFESVLRRQSRDAGAYAGLGEAEFARGDYRRAEAAFRQALRWKPDDAEARQRLAVCEQILALDPDARGLSAAQRFERSRRLLEEIAANAEQCFQGKQQPLPEPLVAARKLLARRQPRRSTEQATQNNLSLAEQLWSERTAACGQPAQAGQALALVMAQLSR